jgi:hypothetical protein
LNTTETTIQAATPAVTATALPKKPRMTKKRIELLKKRNAALSYIQEWCSNLGFEFSRLTPAELDGFVDIYNKNDSKSVTNKALFTHFNSLPAVSSYDVEQLKSLTNVLTVTVDRATKKELDRIERNLSNYNSNIQRYERDIVNYNQYIENHKREIVRTQQTIEQTEKLASDLKSKCTVNKPIENHDKIKVTIDYLMGMIQELCETSNFYKLHELKVPNCGTLSKIEIIFSTIDVLIKDPTSVGVPAFNLGKFLISWKPFGVLGEDSDDQYIPERIDTSLLYYIKVLPFKDNVECNGYYHPHVSDGGVCWGNIQDMVAENLSFNSSYQFRASPMKAFIGLAQLLKSYNASSPYQNLMNFRLKKDPKYYLTLEQTFKEASQVALSLKGVAPVYYWNSHNADVVDKIHPASIRRYLDATGRAVSPEQIDRHSAIEVKLYAKYYMGTTFQHREFKGKMFLKLADNTYHELKTRG